MRIYQRAFPRRGLRRELLPSAEQYLELEGVHLSGRGAWRSMLCPAHADTNPSLRIHMETGRYRCMACGAVGGDILSLHMLRYGVSFIEAARTLGAWGLV
jgi:DNA primase